MSARTDRRLSKYLWAKSHPDKVRLSNQNYRRRNIHKVRAQARARMQRYRTRLRVTPVGAASRDIT